MEFKTYIVDGIEYLNLGENYRYITKAESLINNIINADGSSDYNIIKNFTPEGDFEKIMDVFEILVNRLVAFKDKKLKGKKWN